MFGCIIWAIVSGRAVSAWLLLYVTVVSFVPSLAHKMMMMMMTAGHSVHVGVAVSQMPLLTACCCCSWCGEPGVLSTD